MNQINRLIMGFLFGIIGSYLIVTYGSWYLLLGIFLFCWANNIQMRTNFETSELDKPNRLPKI